MFIRFVFNADILLFRCGSNGKWWERKPDVKGPPVAYATLSCLYRHAYSGFTEDSKSAGGDDPVCVSH
jgi:hypothetical protein